METDSLDKFDFFYDETNRLFINASESIQKKY